MTIGFDYWKTLSHHKKVLIPLINALVKDGHKIWIISAAGANRAETTPEQIKALGLPKEVKVQMVFWEGHSSEQAPMLKLEICKELKIDLFFDDREDICKLLNEHGIRTFRSPFYKLYEEGGEESGKESK